MSERLAALVVACFPAAALVRAEPELRGCPLLVCRTEQREGAGRVLPHAKVIAISRQAARAGARIGATVAQNLDINFNLVVRPADSRAEASARDALLDVAASISPRLEAIDGTNTAEVLIDLGGTQRHFDSEGGLLAALAQRAYRCGFEVGVAIADGRATARLAGHLAVVRTEALVVPHAGAAAWLAPHPIEILRPLLPAEKRDEKALWEMFQRLGLLRVGDLLRLPIDQIATRLGPAAAFLRRVAAGEDESRLRPGRPRTTFVESALLEYPVDSLEALLFVARGLVDRLCTRLEARAFTTRELGLEFGLSGRAQASRRLAAASPSRLSRNWIRLLRNLLEANPLEAAVEELTITARPEPLRAGQLDLFLPAGPAPAALGEVLARVATLCGEHGIGRPTAPLDHRPDSWQLLPFVAESGNALGGAQVSRDGITLPWVLARPLALRALRPPRAVEVGFDRGRLAWVRAPTFGGRVVVASGPWRIETAWWTEQPCRRDYFDIQLSDGGTYRLFEERSRGDWFVDGQYD